MFRYLIHRTAAICVTVIIVGLAVSCCDDDNPVNPPPDDTDTVDYVAYFADGEHPYTYFAYHTATEMIDSFTLPFRSEKGLGISPDGKTMYLSTGQSIATIDLDSFAVIAEYPIPIDGRIGCLSPDGAYLSLYSPALDILRLSDMSVLYHNDGYSFGGIFSANSKTFYCSTFDDNRYIFAHRIKISDTLIVDTTYFNTGRAWRIIPNDSEDKWFVFLWVYLDLFKFEVHNKLNDSVTYSMFFAPGHGDMLLTPNGRYVIFSQPGRLNSDVPPPNYFTVFDVDANDIHRQVSTEGICEENPYGFLTGDICITPDGRHLISTWPNGGGFLFDFDLTMMTFDTCISFGMDKYLLGLSCQSSP